jgi:predicted acylesterase/phospholipase RssA
MSVKHLVLSGGGVRAYATLGTLHYLEKNKNIDFDKIRTFAGSSAGAIIASLLVCGYRPKEILKVGLGIDFKEMFEPNIDNLITHCGFDTGAKFVHKLKELMTKKKIDSNITFKRLYNLTKKKLIITATSLNRRKTKYFDYINTPNHKISDVVRASMGIPILFTTVKQGKEHFVDGGLLDNFPLHLFKNTPPGEIIAIKFKKSNHPSLIYDVNSPHQQIEETFKPINNIADVIFANISCLLEEIENLKAMLSGELFEKSSIIIDAGKYHVLSFNLTAKDRKNLFKIGAKAAKKWIENKKYIHLRLTQLPIKIQSIIWRYIHIDNLSEVHKELNTANVANVANVANITNV